MRKTLVQSVDLALVALLGMTAASLQAWAYLIG